MAKIGNGKPTWDLKPGSDEFRLSNVDGRATVDVGQCAKFGGKLGPGWRAERWGGRAFLSIAARGVTVNGNRGQGKLVTDSKRGCDVYECECIRKNGKGQNRAERHIIVPGSTQYEVHWDTLADVPDTGYVDLLLEFSGDLQWHKQLEPTQEEIDSGVIRPRDMWNGYCVYGSRSGRILRPDGSEIVNYETGKFCDLKCSQLIDAKGNRCWIDQTAPLANPNRLRLYLDAAWLADATFPVVLDPTFGYTSVGASSSSFPTGYVIFSQLVAGAAGNLTSITKYCWSASGTISATLGIYASGPAALVGQSAGGNVTTTAGWVEQSVSPAVAITAVNYHLAENHGSADLNFRYDSASVNTYYKTQTYSAGNLLASGASASLLSTSQRQSIYATYTEAPSGPAIPVLMNQYRQRRR
jgi:hypothetical protein